MKNWIKKLIPSFFLDWYHFFLAGLAAFLYCFPSKKLKVIGVAGTDGKTTVVNLAAKILEEAGNKVALSSTIKFKIGEKEWLNTLKMTMPGRLILQKFLRQAVRAGCQYAILEVTSEGMKQHRHRFIDFEAAVFTNLTPEHIEAHGSFEKYRAAEGKLFQATKGIHIINIDDENASYFLQFPAQKKYLYQFKIQNSKCKITPYKFLADARNYTGQAIQNSKFSKALNDFTLNLKLPGDFNIYNALAATCVGLSQGISLALCKRAVEKVEGIPGRMEKVISEPFQVFVDYAVTPNALQKVYETLSENSKSETLNSKPRRKASPYHRLRRAAGQVGFLRGRQIPNSKFQIPKLICVLGACGGGRDKWKRPVLGEIAARYCDEVIITNEDPYDENPIQILEDIEKGVLKIKNLKLNKNLELKIKNYQKILDRREAIKKSLELASPGDVVIITGKGCEPWICVAEGKRIPWDDRKVVKEEFDKGIISNKYTMV